MSICPRTGKTCLLKKCVHITDIENGKATTSHLCQVCSKDVVQKNLPVEIKKQIQPQVKLVEFPIKESDFNKDEIELLKSFIGMIGGNPNSIIGNKKVVKENCPSCGMSLKDVAKIQRLGCPVCYQHYQKELARIVEGCHDSLEHKGKVPKNWKKKQEKEARRRQKDLNLKQTLQLLKERQKECIEVENYEEAKVLRDQIKEMEVEIEKNWSPD